ncbi:hypothetical protein N7457_004325 [Penicillium paradoxum]|uniref:uncharacterized protein n=1 Tax=Penicillium paradoxum TaxID=176176 RepID=UPI0025494A47|nr:uncharacterized protein N7457_004325 [Penicillium paradoxum]KAJ5782551.1 hypothetical protein N7457_004325 [Penicillium paradoxum]
MSLRPFGYQCNLPYAQFVRNAPQQRHTIISRLNIFTHPPNARCIHRKSTTSPQHANRASLSLASFLSDLLRPVHTPQRHDKLSWAQQRRHESSGAKDPELCAHCGGKSIAKLRKLVDPSNPSSGWHCKPCLRNIRVHGHLPNKEQLVTINRRRLMRESGEASKTSPCKHCGELTAPRSSRKFIDPDNPSAGFHCRPCVRHMNVHGNLPTEQDLAAFRYRKEIRHRQIPATASRNNEPGISEENLANPTRSSSSKRSDPTRQKQSRDAYPCTHCGDITTSNSKRRLVEPQNPAAGYYCQPCTRCLLETDALPSSAQLTALKRLRENRSKSNPRDLKSPCRHCGEMTAPSSKRRLVEAKKPDSGYYCRACADCLIETSSLPSEMRLAVRRAREQVRLKNLQVNLSKVSQSPVPPPAGESTLTGLFTEESVKTCAH